MPSGGRPASFFTVLTEAVADVGSKGYTSEEQMRAWRAKLEEAAAFQFGLGSGEAERMAQEGLGAIWQRLYERGGLVRLVPGVERWTINRLAPHLRGELDRSIAASAALIRLNKQEAVRKTLQRFVGWSTSIPAGGAAELDKRALKSTIGKPLASLPFVERRVLIDQGAKLASSLERIVALDNGAIAAEWHSHWRQRGYDYRPDHKARDGKIYLVRGSWAQAQGLVKVGPAGYTDAITQPAEEPFCRCRYKYLFHLRSVPAEMLTEKGKAKLAEARARVEGLTS